MKAVPCLISAADLVRAALLAAAANDSQRRDELLSQALRKDPDCPPARWHSGYVRLDGQWLSTDDAQRRAAADQRLAEYRKLRDASVRYARWDLSRVDLVDPRSGTLLAPL